MAIGHITYDRSSVEGQKLASALTSLEQGVAGIRQMRDAMIQMRDNGTTSTSYIVGKFGFTDPAVADAAFAEIDSLVNKLATDASVTNVATALKQIQDKFR